MSLVCVNDFESLLKIHVYVVDVQLPLPFRTPFLDVAQSEDLDFADDLALVSLAWKRKPPISVCLRNI